MILTMNEYQHRAVETRVYPTEIGILDHSDVRVGVERKLYAVYPALGLCGEAGEVAEKVKKAIRDDWPVGKLREEVIKELGDVLWYVAMIAYDLGLPLNQIAELNLAKLAARKADGTIHGQGDDR